MQRDERIFATPPPGGVPGEDDDILIELFIEVYGIITGPPAWRKTLLTSLKEYGFKKHPLAPCIAVMYEDVGDKKDQFTGLLIMETDDILCGGVGNRFHEAVTKLRKRFIFGKWGCIMDQAQEYGGRTLKQNPDYSVTISMFRYLESRAREINLEKADARLQKHQPPRQKLPLCVDSLGN